MILPELSLEVARKQERTVADQSVAAPVAHSSWLNVQTPALGVGSLCVWRA